MKNYNINQLQEVKNKIQYNQEISDKACIWVDKNLKNEDYNKINLLLKNSKNILNKIYNKIDSKPVIAIFGASQVGKSYLIKNLLSKYNSPFVIKDKTQEYDFLKDINPPGVGAESTGVVTRFTIDSNIKYEDYPIQVKILSPTDIIITLIDSFYSDIKKVKIDFNLKEIDNQLTYFESNYSEKKQSYITEYDVLEIKEYFEKHLNKNALIFETFKEIRLFERIAKIINGYNYNEWDSIFKILWNANENISNLYNLLIGTISKIEFEQNIYIKFNEVLRGGGEILDVKRIKELFNNKKNIQIKLNNGSEKELNASYLTAIISELIFQIPNELNESKEFLKNSDLLDFPGARSRLTIDQSSISNEVLSDMFLRGKVSYLFNKYSDDFNINNLLFCANDKQLDVNEIPSLLENWINRNIGENIVERSTSLKENSTPPLFVIFTFFNNQLKFDTTNDIDYANDYHKLDYKWETRFNRFFENEIVTQTKNWHREWTNKENNFKNLYLLRDYKYSTDTFDGFEQTGIENEIKKERIEYLSTLKKSFINYPFVNDHFKNPEYCWNETTIENKDGSQIIINNLKEVSNNFTKTTHSINKANKIIENIKNSLNYYLHSDDISIIRSKNMRELSEFQFSFNSIMAKNIESFTILIDIFSIDKIEIYNLINTNISYNENEINIKNIDQVNILKNQYPEINKANNFDDIINILKLKLWYTTNDQVIEFLNNNNIKEEHFFNKKSAKSKSELYTDLVIEYWLNKINSKNNYEKLISTGFNYSFVTIVTDHYYKILTNRNIRNKIVYILDEVVSIIESNRGIEEFLSEVFSIIINDLVYRFDFDYLKEEEKIELKLLNINIEEIENNDIEITDKSIENLLENIDNDKTIDTDLLLKNYNKWIKLLRISLLVHCGFSEFNVEANNNLNEIIEQFTFIE